MRDQFKGKVVIVTGAGSGIGLATAELFARQGAAVCIADIDSQSGEKAEQVIKAKGGKCAFVETDVSEEKSVKSMVDEAVEYFGGINILVNNAADFTQKSLEATVEDWNKVISVNIVGCFLCVKHAFPEIRKGGGGAIVNIGSISGLIAQPEQLTYNTTKGGVISMTKCLALELAKFKIRVNCVCPGVVRTEHLRKKVKEKGMIMEEADEKWGKSNFLGRIADPEEIASAVLFLASSQASFITGTILLVDGGYMAM